MKTKQPIRFAAVIAVAGCTVLAARSVEARVEGIPGPTFHLVAKTGHISSPDGNNILVWGFSSFGGTVQYPGPTMIVQQGDVVDITLDNELSEPVSILLPGQTVNASGGNPGLLTAEAPPGGSVQYSFTADSAGTYLYQSGSHMDLQIEMGLIGALIVRPAAAGRAYDDPASSFDREFLFLLSEMDVSLHQQVEFGMPYDTSTARAVQWFINGRSAPDTMAPAFAPWLPTQPYNCMPMMHPGDKVLLRLIGGGRDLHPFHTHGNNTVTIARDGQMLQTAPGAGADLGVSDFTITVAPGQTTDALFEWTGAKLGWDIYGHAPGDPMEMHESAADHGKPLPVVLPDPKALTLGAFWSGSPFLGASAALPPGSGTNNLDGGYFFMWHSHAEREMTNDDAFPGGLMTMLMIEPHMMDLME